MVGFRRKLHKMTQHGEKCGDLGGHYVTLKKIWAPFTLASRGSNEKTAIIKKLVCLRPKGATPPYLHHTRLKIQKTPFQ